MEGDRAEDRAGPAGWVGVGSLVNRMRAFPHPAYPAHLPSYAPYPALPGLPCLPPTPYPAS